MYSATRLAASFALSAARRMPATFPRPLQPFPRGGEFGSELFHGGEGELVFAGYDFVRECAEGVVGEGGVG